MTALAGLRRMIFGISDEEVTARRRGFPNPDAPGRERLEEVARAFVHGYHRAIDDDQPESLLATLDATDSEKRGWTYEGAAMALALRDHFSPWRRQRLARLFAAAPHHIYMLHVGAGWAMARLHLDPHRFLAGLDPILRWLAVDGYGFHEGFFHGGRALLEGAWPPDLDGYGRRAHDQGLGRALWFYAGADVEHCGEVISNLDDARHGDLWSGIGLACAYAGAAPDDEIARLPQLAGRHAPALAQGAAFAAKARLRAGNPATHTEHACQLLCGCGSEAAASVTDEALAVVAARAPETPEEHDSAEPSYEAWRRLIAEQFAGEGSGDA